MKPFTMLLEMEGWRDEVEGQTHPGGAAHSLRRSVQGRAGTPAGEQEKPQPPPPGGT